jgi:hypothetical protein
MEFEDTFFQPRSIQKNSYLKADSRPPGEDVPLISCRLKIHYPVHNSSSRDPTVSQFNLVHISHLIYFYLFIYLFFYLGLFLTTEVFPQPFRFS